MRWSLSIAVVGACAACTAEIDVVIGRRVPVPDLPAPGASATPTATPDIPTFGDGADGSAVLGIVDRVNRCVAAVSSGPATLTVTDNSGLSGQWLLVVQTLHADPGRFELVRVAATAGLDTVTLVDPLSRTYAAGAQACTVPRYVDLTILPGGAIEAEGWNGASGGIVAFLVSGTLTVAGRVDAGGRGFRGGACSVQDTTTVHSSSDMDPSAGHRGESALGTGLPGRTANGAGGGGGNPARGGGGGGANAGIGGLGGRGLSGGAGSAADAAGRPGLPLSNSLDDPRLLFGGGGGGGQTLASIGAGTPCDGNAGGGAVFVQAADLGTGNGPIQADGAPGNPIVMDGISGGGGGAGGTLWLHAGAAGLWSGELRARGGRGQDTTLETGQQIGPGGGGSGGWVLLPGTDPGATRVVSEGPAGVDGGDPTTNHFATAGGVGVVLAVP